MASAWALIPKGPTRAELGYLSLGDIWMPCTVHRMLGLGFSTPPPPPYTMKSLACWLLLCAGSQLAKRQS